MSNPLFSAQAPVVPDLSGFGIKGKIAQRTLTNLVDEFSEYLTVLQDFAQGDDLIDAKIAEVDNEATDAYAETMADLDAEDEAAVEELANAIKVLEEEAEAAQAIRDSKRTEAKATLVSSLDLDITVPTAEENAEAVQAIDILRKSFSKQVATTIQAIGKDRVGTVLDDFKLPELGRGSGARKSAGGFKPRFQSVNIDGVSQAEPQVAKVAASLGISRDALVASLTRVVSQGDYEAASNGAAFNFDVDVNGVTKSLTVVKGNPAKSEAPASDSAA